MALILLALILFEASCFINKFPSYVKSDNLKITLSFDHIPVNFFHTLVNCSCEKMKTYYLH